MRHGTVFGDGRNTIFGKTLGEVERVSGGLTLRSPVSGATLTCQAPTAGSVRRAVTVRDPVSGTVLRLSGSRAHVTAPVLRQRQVHARTFHITRDIDVAIALLREARGFGRATNEKLGTAGTPTGLAKELLSGSYNR